MTTLSPEILHIRSPDGTRLGVERVGHGPPLLAVHGGIADRSRWNLLKERVADRFTLHLLDRRGRGDSTQESTEPYALGREVEDVLAVVEAIGDPVRYVGHSYGALIGLEVLAHTNAITRALLYEPPFETPGHAIISAETLDAISARIEAGDREGALETFYREVVGADPTPFKHLPMWPIRVAVVHTIEREGRIGLTYTMDPARFAKVATPVRILVGTESPPAFPAAAQVAVDALPNADIVLLEGQGHTMLDTDPAGFVAHMTDFLA